MGMPLALQSSGDHHASDAIDDSLKALILRSVIFSENLKPSSCKSLSFNGRGSPPATILKSFTSGKLVDRGSSSFDNSWKMSASTLRLEANISMTNNAAEEDDNNNKIAAAAESASSGALAIDILDLNKKRSSSPAMELRSPKHEAAVRLQKVYKSFRTRRQLADCAVLVEQRWWKLLDFALLKRSSVSFFDIEKPESAVSRWSRARTRAAKVGKGLSKDEKAQKLALQHWLEAIDPRHRYGHNLHYYYVCWLRCESKQPFFYWLDVGEGKEVDLKEQCSRSKLQQQCIKYLGPKERETYEVIVEDAKFLYKQSRKVLDTTEGPKDAKWIFVLSTTKTLYVGQKKKGTFQHSSFLAGGATSAAGRLILEGGVLKAVWPHSGHYRPTEQNFQEFISFLEENNVDVSSVKKFPSEEEAEQLMSGLRSCSSKMNSFEPSESVEAEPELNSHDQNTSHAESSPLVEAATGSNTSSSVEDEALVEEQRASQAFAMNLCQRFHCKLAVNKPEEEHKGKSDHGLISSSKESTENGLDGEKELTDNSAASAQECMFVKRNLFSDDKEEEEEAALVPPETILRRINSKKGMQSYQLGKQLSFKWTTGAGPRIVCVRDYPSELQFRSLEQVHLSPRSSPRHTAFHNPSLQEMAVPKEQQQQHRLKS